MEINFVQSWHLVSADCSYRTELNIQFLNVHRSDIFVQ